MPRSRYEPKRSEFQDHCDVPHCNEERVVVCKRILPDGKVCGKLGHPDFYKYDEDQLIGVVEHAHFLINKDKGRNCFHSQPNAIIPAPMEIRHYTWRTKRDIDRWLCIPGSVRENMGWDLL